MTRPAASEAQLERDAAAFHAALNDLLRIYQYRDRDRICCHDVSVTQCHALELLVERGPLRSQTLAEALRLDKSTTTRVVDALVRKDYVERLPDPDDARAVQLRPTRKGRALHRRIDDELVAQQAELLQDLEPRLRAGVTEVIRRVAQAAEARFLAGRSTGPATCTPASSCPS